jgi:uncharacterized protein
LSYSLDVNILLYASDRKSPFYPRAVEFLEECASRSELLCLAWPTLMSYLRMVTNASIFRSPLPPSEAMKNVEALIALPQVSLLSEQTDFWDFYRQATKGLTVTGKLVPDAHLAALLLQHGVPTLYTNDSDFDEFAFLETRNPFR